MTGLKIWYSPQEPETFDQEGFEKLEYYQLDVMGFSEIKKESKKQSGKITKTKSLKNNGIIK